MARKKIELFIEIHNEKEFNTIIQTSENQLICAEVYSTYFGSCTALDRLFTTIKLDWSDGRMILLKVPSEEIEALQRFRHQSEPVYIFILNTRVTKVFRGVNAMKLAEVAKTELYYLKLEIAGTATGRPLYQLEQPTQDETEWLNVRKVEKQLEKSTRAARRAVRQSARKKHRAELMVPHLQTLNFVLFWPHATHAHPELYERWDANNIIMVGREEIELTKETAMDTLYAGDAPINEASMFKLLSGPALAICFRLLDEDKHFVSLVRSILYEEIPPIDEDRPMSEQTPRKTAFDLYKSFSPTKEEVWQARRQERRKKKKEDKEKRERHLSEMRRLARQAKEELLETRRKENERRKLDLLKAGNLTALDQINVEPDEELEDEIPEELPEDVEEESSEPEDKDEYLPPPGLLVPGFYAPPNDIAKANGMAILFPKLVVERVTPQPEFLPPHVLVMLNILQRHAAIQVMLRHKAALIHMGIFKATQPFNAEPIAYTVHQYDRMKPKMDDSMVKLAFMLSVKVDVPLLELMDFNPVHVSRNTDIGEEECAAMFPVDYADDYPQFEDFGDRTVLRPKLIESVTDL